MKTKKECIPARLRWFVWERDNFTCHYCGSRQFLSIDHRIPESKGGTLHPANLRTACQSCNSRKATKSAEEFYVPDMILTCLDLFGGLFTTKEET